MMARFTALVLLVGGAACALIVSLGGRLGETAVRGALLGAGLAAVGAIGGMALLVRGQSRGFRGLTGALLLGILARLVVFGAALIGVGLRAGTFDLVATAMSLLGFYAVFQSLEVRFVLKGLRSSRS